MIQDISGVYELKVNNTFNINSHEWQIHKKGNKTYIIDNTTDTYISGLFKVKGHEDEFQSFDYGSNYYLMSIEDNYIYIQFVNEKILK